MCICCVRYKKQRCRHDSFSMAIDQGAGIKKEPVYDTIGPAYEVIGTGLGGEIKLNVTKNQGAGIEKEPVYDTISPVYDTIGPAYEIICTRLGGEIKLNMTKNDAYNW